MEKLLCNIKETYNRPYYLIEGQRETLLSICEYLKGLSFNFSDNCITIYIPESASV